MENLKSKLTNRKGFSLVELLVVITIIAILSVVAYTAVGGQTTKAKDSRRMQDLTTIQTALEIFFADKGEYPTKLDNGTNDQTGSATDLVPKYMPKMALDPVTLKEYTYKTNTTRKKYQLAATLEKEDDKYEAYVVGNSSDNLLKGDATTPNPYWKYESENWAGCSEVKNVDSGANCVPYKPIAP